MKKPKIIYGAIIALFISQTMVLAGGPPWSDHQEPYSFIFGIDEQLQNIDDHQQTMVLPDGTLKGFFLY